MAGDIWIQDNIVCMAAQSEIHYDRVLSMRCHKVLSERICRTPSQLFMYVGKAPSNVIIDTSWHEIIKSRWIKLQSQINVDQTQIISLRIDLHAPYRSWSVIGKSKWSALIHIGKSVHHIPIFVLYVTISSFCVLHLIKKTYDNNWQMKQSMHEGNLSLIIIITCIWTIC